MPPCPDPRFFQELLHGTLSAEQQAELTRHLDACAACREKLDRLAAGDDAWLAAARDLGEQAPPEPALEQVMRAIKHDAGPTETQTPAADCLDFLDPSEKPGHLGRLAHYEILQIIGQGGMGIVLKAMDESLQRVVAIKVLAPQLATNATARQRFQREARAAAAISHEHVVTIHAVDEAKGLPYLVMQYVAGVSLQERLDKSGPLGVKEILRIGHQAACGLAAAHPQGLVHRDVKPANILLENGVERVKLTDFGLARVADDASLTQSGFVAGTPQYMAPEQADGLRVDHRADLFSLGSVLYAMSTGRPPFRASTTAAVLRRVSEDEPRPVREINPEIPEWLEAIISKLHAKEPADRFQSAADVAELLGEHLAHLQQPARTPLPAQPPPARPVRGAPPPRRLGWVVAAVVLLGLGCCMLPVGSMLLFLSRSGQMEMAAQEAATPQAGGTLLIFSPDPAVIVHVEDAGGRMSHEGPWTVSGLKPGTYHIWAEKDGRLVTVQPESVLMYDGLRVSVYVRPEVPDKGSEAFPFVNLSGVFKRQRWCATLADAVAAGYPGSTIEVRGDGPFDTPPITIPPGYPHTIRAGTGFRPVFRLNAAGQETHAPLIRTESPLVLEGLELQRVTPTPWARGMPHRRVVEAKAPLHAANCRFVLKPGESCVEMTGADFCELRNCEFLTSHGHGVGWTGPAGSQIIMENCVHTGIAALWMNQNTLQVQGVSVRLAHNTLLGACACGLSSHPQPAPKHDRFRVTASANVFANLEAALFYQPMGQDNRNLTPGPVLQDTLGWADWRNLYLPGGPYLVFRAAPLETKAKQSGIKTLADWRAFWGSEDVESREGSPVFEGGDLRARAVKEPEKLTPADFRLKPDSPGHGAGKDGQDLGADTTLLGPGASYERWKKTPDFQRWLKALGQKK